MEHQTTKSILAIICSTLLVCTQVVAQEEVCDDDTRAQFNACLFECVTEFPACQNDIEESIEAVLKQIGESCEDQDGEELTRKDVRRMKRFARAARRAGFLERDEQKDVNQELNECKNGEEEEENEEDTVEVCHIPPGNPDALHTILIGEPAVSAHLGHGDLLGACPDDSEEEEESSEETE